MGKSAVHAGYQYPMLVVPLLHCIVLHCAASRQCIPSASCLSLAPAVACGSALLLFAVIAFYDAAGALQRLSAWQSAGYPLHSLLACSSECMVGGPIGPDLMICTHCIATSGRHLQASS